MVSKCIELCETSYSDKLPLDFYEVEDLRYGVVVDGDTTFVIFRGTSNLYNWIRDARVWPTRSCGGYLTHKGFVRAYQKLCASGLPVIKGDNVIATGHSLGGALATLYAEHTGSKLVTFGSPRVYFRFGSAPLLNHYRVVCDDDPVPMIPKIFYNHRQPVSLTLEDKDYSIIDAKDHNLKVYKSRYLLWEKNNVGKN